MTGDVKTECIVIEAKFITFGFGYFSFELQDGEVLVFEDVDQKVLDKYNLKSDEWNGLDFEITYCTIIEDLGNENFVSLRLDDLKFKGDLPTKVK